MTEKKYYIGIDGGGTSTVFTLVSNDGMIFEQIKLGPSNYQLIGMENTINLLSEGVQVITSELEISLEELESIFFGLAGIGDIESDALILKEKLNNIFSKTTIYLDNDTKNALEGSLIGADGINIISGTGSIGLGKYRGNYVRSGGWHHIFGGDEGSGYWLASQLLRHFTRQSDGREPKTLLYYKLKEKYKWKKDSNMLSYILNECNSERDKIARFSLDLYDIAVESDPVCMNIIDEAAKELSEIILAIYNKLNPNEKLPVSYSGGVFKMGNLILKPLSDYLKGYNVELQEPKLSPNAGAVLLAIKGTHNKKVIDKLIEVEKF